MLHSPVCLQLFLNRACPTGTQIGLHEIQTLTRRAATDSPDVLQMLQAISGAKRAVQSGLQMQQQGYSDRDVYEIYKEVHTIRFDLGIDPNTDVNDTIISLLA